MVLSDFVTQAKSSKVIGVLLNGWIFPIGEIQSVRVCARSLRLVSWLPWTISWFPEIVYCVQESISGTRESFMGARDQLLVAREYFLGAKGLFPRSLTFCLYWEGGLRRDCNNIAGTPTL